MLLLLKPSFKNYIWGGNKLKEVFSFDCDLGAAEAWGISAHPHGLSTVVNGPYEGESLLSLWENHKELFGNHPAKEFPILVKLIDAKKDLSIQVHPNDDQAKKYNSLGKKECWYILETEEKTKIIIGHHARTMNEFLEFVNKNQYSELVQTIPCHKGDFFFIDSGTLHAICAGTLLLEVQQSSDLTYRFYDYNRVDKDGNKRPLHLEDALDVVKIPDSEIKHKLENTPFNVEFEDLEFKSHQQNSKYGTFFVVLEGSPEINNKKLQKGAFGFVSADEEDIVICGETKIAWITLN